MKTNDKAFPAEAAKGVDALILADCRELHRDDVLPESFTEGWRRAIKEEVQTMQTPENTNAKEKKPLMKRFVWLRPLIAVAAALVLVVGGILTGANITRKRSYDTPAMYASGDADYAARGPGDAEMPMLDMAESAAAAAPRVEATKEKRPSKVIRTADLRLSSKQFDDDVKRIEAAMAEVKGRIESSDLSSYRNNARYLSMTIRVPSENLDAFITKLSAIGRLGSVSQSAQDVSDKYYDTDTRLKTLRAKMERLQELMKKGDTIEEILPLETEIANTQYQIDSLAGTLAGLDSRVDDATVTLSLTEELEAQTVQNKEEGLWDRIKSGFTIMTEQVLTFLADVVVFIAVFAPYVLVLALIIFVIVKLIKRRKKK